MPILVQKPESGGRYMISIPSELKIKLKIICAKRDIPVNQFCKEALEEAITKYKNLLLSI